MRCSTEVAGLLQVSIALNHGLLLRPHTPEHFCKTWPAHPRCFNRESM